MVLAQRAGSREGRGTPSGGRFSARQALIAREEQEEPPALPDGTKARSFDRAFCVSRRPWR
ncbi:hypothetical protein Rumeso_03057 [Rubellimicrobium mesophilum DSM 19309]|uniref:Uncharacterized protein n=1 Tax=Rubellimicrobium mesophilum DSM 19309 TaxID=442562 RepID=A0A017HLZ4_9RHOB|nr:hypothetical protein Rumeso_03057 [Rubellimicrobium mesophilum DSM 19309]